jgi:succinate dehydrogenase / fumarate reductase iron-sulfur subunit
MEQIMDNKLMNLTLKIWRQKDANAVGSHQTYALSGVSPAMSFLEMLDVLNEKLVSQGENAVAFDHDCREGICGMCALMIDGQAHGPDMAATTCQLHMRRYKDGDTITIEPFRAKAFPIVRDLCVDRSAFDRIQQAGGFCSVNTGAAQDANNVLISHGTAEMAMDAAACIGCGACVAACPNASAMLFVGAKVSQYALLPQGQPEREKRALAMRAAMDAEGFGHCTNEYECEAACPKEIKISNIARLNREYFRATLISE